MYTLSIQTFWDITHIHVVCLHYITQTLSKSESALCLRDFSAIDLPTCKPGKMATAPCCGSRQIESFIAGWGGDDDVLVRDSCGLDTTPFTAPSASLLDTFGASRSAAVFCRCASLNCLWQLTLQNSDSSASSSNVAYRHNHANLPNYQQCTNSDIKPYIRSTASPFSRIKYAENTTFNTNKTTSNLASLSTQLHAGQTNKQ